MAGPSAIDAMIVDAMLIDAMLVDVCLGRTPETGSPDRSAGPGFVQQAVDATRFHRIAPLAHVALRDVDPVLGSRLREDRDRAVRHHLRITALLTEIARLLDGIRWIVFKGPVLSEVAHPLPGLRSYKDLDILVSPADLRAACERFFEAGWNGIFDSEMLRDPLPGELALASPAQVLVDLHWSLVLPTDLLRPRFRAGPDDLLERRVPVGFGTADAWTLDPADALVHVCHHAAHNGAKRLVHLLDADQLARRVEDWETVAERAAAWCAEPETVLVLGRARRLFGTPAPPELAARLGAPRSFDRMLSLIDRVSPAPRARGGASLAGMVARAARPWTARTAGAALGGGARELAGRLRPAGPEAPRLPAGPRVVADYLSAVEGFSMRASWHR